MKSLARHPLAILEWWLVVLLLLSTVLAGSFMIRLATVGGFTALAEPMADASDG